MSKWMKCTLGDIITFQRGYDLTKSKMIFGQYPVIASNGIIGWHNEYTTENPSITVGRSGNVGNPFLYNGRSWSHNTTLYIKEYKNCDKLFIYYLLKELNLKNYSSGSAVPTLNRNHIHNLEILVPPLKEQQKISKILSSLDEKIEINRKINENLEEQAKEIFKRWFVDYEFPNEEGQPYKSSGGEMIESELGLIPKGWEIKKFEELICKLKTGLNPRKNFVLGKGNNFYVTIKNMINQDVILDERCEKIDDNAIEIINKRSDLKKRDILFSAIGTIGRVCILDKTPTNWNISESIFTIRAIKDDLAEFLYFLMLSDNFQNYSLQLASGSVQKGIRMQDLKKYTLATSIDLASNYFGKIVSPIVKKYKTNQCEIQKLSSLRDILLPKLMTGEIDVSEIDI